MNLLIINGPNINMLGIREPEIYGSGTYSELVDFITASVESLGGRCDCYQSNHEGDIVTEIQNALGKYDAIIINPAAYTHTSVAILDALKSISLPAVEVHISDPMQREAFRHTSYAGMACIKRFAGFGWDGYKMAAEFLNDYLKEQK